MRPAPFLLGLAMLGGAAAPAHAGVHLKLPKEHRRHHGSDGTAAPPPVTTDTPGPVWAPKPRG